MQASPTDIEEIREELVEQGLLKARASKKKKKPKKPTPEKFIASDGTEISVGKNNKQNDFVTFKTSARNQTHGFIQRISQDPMSLYIRIIRLKKQCLKQRILQLILVKLVSLLLCRWIILIKQVKKPNGAKPGFVIYFEQKTLFVTPEEDLVRKLRK